MIVVKLSGGLGNQMFQYAAALSLASKNNQKLFIDLSFFYIYELHEYALKHFNISAEIIDDIGKFGYKLINKFVPSKYRDYLKKMPPYGNKIYTESRLSFDSSFFNLGENIYLDGYWQSEKYFKDYDKIIRNEFTLKNSLNGLNKEIADKISDTNSISIHIRRGDYQVNKDTKKIHGVCSLNYYYKAIEFMSKKIEMPFFFIFSDDIEWVKSNLHINYAHLFVEHNSEFNGERYTANKNHEDLRLMSLCRNNIIANSSFSWWGAWLNNNPQKIIVAPTNWYNNNELNLQALDIVPKSWIKLE